MGRRWMLAALVCPVLIVSCASTTPPALEETPEPGAEPTIRVAEIADRYHLSMRHEEDRRRVVLEGPAGRVTLYPRTTVATVNGSRVAGMGRVAEVEGGWTIRESDASRIQAAMSRRRARRPEPVVARLPDPVPVVLPAPAPTRDASPPGWRVPLRREWRYVVIHHSGTTSGNAASFHRHHVRDNGWDGLGYHFVIGNGRGSGDGQVEVGYRWTEQRTGAHAGRGRNNVNTMNETGVGVALVGDFEKSRPTAGQIASLDRLVAFLRSYCGIPRNRILVHCDLKCTCCPGRYFPTARYVLPGREIPAAFR